MGYSVNLIQRVSDGNILGACGCSFIPINSQADYKNCLFIEGDPDDIPDIYNRFEPGDYRIMTFLVPGEYGNTYPEYGGVPFGSITSGPNANNANITPDGSGRFFLGSNFGLWASFVGNWDANGRPSAYLAFTVDQTNTYGIEGFPAEYLGKAMPPQYAGYVLWDMYEMDNYSGIYGGWIRDAYSTINALFFSI